LFESFSHLVGERTLFGGAIEKRKEGRKRSSFSGEGKKGKRDKKG